MNVKGNLIEIEASIEEACKQFGRDRSNVQIIAVTKYVSIDRTIEAVEAGITHLGESRDDGLLKKWDELNHKVAWHFIGSLQTKKVKKIIDKVDYIHSLDRLSLAEEIHKRSSKQINCFVQVNVSGEESKHGIHSNEVIDFIHKMKDFPNIRVVGLMTMAPFTEDQQVIRECFRNLRLLSLDVQALTLPYAPCLELSMGMSNDFEIAVEEGATFLRIGTSLVGKEF
ncbi:YggS family pyridoxal phosphate-dependent enzyme [Bacillus luteolus]|uniref:Pyridoxal phosphate homeostasis protein n=1 Tax=Litchfieldia luteola TaxID=682179 RepID=A0ABR9QK68_9BACI|nr:YggS family pyridoxal phosphate-dependent enzyme [Cytobacillus luteolus]MBE4908806.1 YggS family pyridoxal phosphate-dependent enzyme [Cytobacillus luteolus]MBP1941664.1 pyridoxal phosphate enzyme (YggS family) [Cytobacillus luteolus]